MSLVDRVVPFRVVKHGSDVSEEPPTDRLVVLVAGGVQLGGGGPGAPGPPFAGYVRVLGEERLPHVLGPVAELVGERRSRVREPRDGGVRPRLPPAAQRFGDGADLPATQPLDSFAGGTWFHAHHIERVSVGEFPEPGERVGSEHVEQADLEVGPVADASGTLVRPLYPASSKPRKVFAVGGLRAEDCVDLVEEHGAATVFDESEGDPFSKLSSNQDLLQALKKEKTCAEIVTVYGG